MDIKNPDNVELQILEIKNYIKSIYTGKNKYDKDNIPFVVIYAKTDQSFCIIMTRKSKKDLEKMKEITSKLSNNQLEIKGIKLSAPYVFNPDVKVWWGKNIGYKKSGVDRWSTLKHNGPYFSHLLKPYKHLHSYLTYDGVKYFLTPKEEKVARYYASRILSEQVGNVNERLTLRKDFNSVFFKDFKLHLTKEHRKIFKNFSNIGWDNLVDKLKIVREENKAINLTKEQKNEKKMQTEEVRREYGYAYVDGHREKVGNYNVELPGIFYGRSFGKNTGKIKKEINPEEVTINIGPNDKVPTPPKGHKWGKIVHDKQSVWLAKWKDGFGDIKYMFLSSEGQFKGESDFLKYEKARKLEKHINTIRNKYMDDVLSTNMVKKQLGTVLYLIDHFGIRVGNEKDDSSDVVGASTLKVGHIKFKEPDTVIFDFFGKDNIRFYKELQVPKSIYNNMIEFCKKDKTDDVFNKISAIKINSYLKKFDKSFTAKVFRTRLASVVMFDALKKVKIPKNTTKARIKTLFNKANIKVANILNHVRNISHKARERIKKMEIQLKDLRKEKKVKIDAGRKINTINKRIATIKNRIEAAKDVIKMAVNTSLSNYIDPRIIVAWTEKRNIDISNVYSATLQNNFKWAIETTPKNWNYLSSSLDGNPKLEPVNLIKTRQRYFKEGSKQEWKLLHKLCINPSKIYLNNFSDKFLKFIYPIAKYGVTHKTGTEINKILVNYHNSII
jgi:DNA topoisomerase IB